MKKQLSFALLIFSIFSLNMLPGQAATSNLESEQLETNQNEATLVADVQWCVELPWMGLFCWDL
jgi:hypothetical protein